jgi:hypothetical protein
MKYRDPDFSDATDAQYDVLFTVEGYRESGLLLRYDSNITLFYRGKCTRNLVYAAFWFVMAGTFFYIAYDWLIEPSDDQPSWSYVVPLVFTVVSVLATIVFVGTAAQYDMLASMFQPNKKYPSGPMRSHIVYVSSQDYRF